MDLHRRSPIGMILAAAALSTILAAGGAGTDPGAHESPTVLRPGDLTWRDLPSGVRVAVLQGDPEKPGPLTMRLRYPPGFRKGPHFHPVDVCITVLSGSYFRGYGNTFDRSKAVELGPGDFTVNPAGIVHYEWSDSETLVQIHAVGPWRSIDVDEKGRPVGQSGE